MDQLEIERNIDYLVSQIRSLYSEYDKCENDSEKQVISELISEKEATLEDLRDDLEYLIYTKKNQ